MFFSVYLNKRNVTLYILSLPRRLQVVVLVKIESALRVFGLFFGLCRFVCSCSIKSLIILVLFGSGRSPSLQVHVALHRYTATRSKSHIRCLSRNKYYEREFKGAQINTNFLYCMSHVFGSLFEKKREKKFNKMFLNHFCLRKHTLNAASQWRCSNDNGK